MSNLDLYAGLTELGLSDAPLELGDGIVLSKTKLSVLMPVAVVNEEETRPNAPALWHAAGEFTTITAQLFIPASVGGSFGERIELARFMVFLIRLWVHPGVSLFVACSGELALEAFRQSDDTRILLPVDSAPRHFALTAVDLSRQRADILWVKENWRVARKLHEESAEFRLAVSSLDSGQFLRNTALTLVSLWGALEAIFSPSTSELRFRVSALIACYLEPPGDRRHNLQQEIAKLYDKRSAAAHGQPKHASEDVLRTFELLRRVIIRIIQSKAVPLKPELERRLFSGGAS